MSRGARQKTRGRARGALLIALFSGSIACAPDPSASPDAGADAACTTTLPDCPPSPPSYQGEVAAIIASRCEGCHYPGNPSSKFEYSTYASVHASSGSMLTQVYTCKMPLADAGALTDSERTALLTWLVCGAPNN